MKSFTFDHKSHIGKMDGVVWPSVTQLLQENKLIDYSMVPNEVLEKKRILGSRVDEGIRLLNDTSLDEEHFNASFPECIPYLEAYRKFRVMEQYDPADTKCGRLVSTKWRFHGQPDEHGIVIFQKGLKNYLADWKCTFKMFNSTGAQLSGYEILLKELLGIKIDKRFGILLKPNGAYDLVPFDDRNDKQDFLACVHLHWQRREKYKTSTGEGIYDESYT